MSDFQTARRFAETARVYTASATATIPPNIGFRINVAGEYVFHARNPDGGVATPAITLDMLAGEQLLLDIARLTTAEGDILVLFAQ